MQSVLEKLGLLATDDPLLYALITLGITTSFGVVFGRLMDWLSTRAGLDTSRRRHTQDRVGE